MQNRRLKAGAVLTLLAVVGGMGAAQAAGRGSPGRGSGSAPAVAAAVVGDFNVTYTVTSSWRGGFVGDVTLTNGGSSTVTGWTLGWTFPDAGQRVVAAWNARVSQSGSAVTARNAAYNGTLAPGASARFGIQGSFSGSNPVPGSFTVNGSGSGGTTTSTTTSRAGSTTTSTTSRTTTSTTTRATTTRATTTTTRAAGGYALPRANAGLDYQLGQAYPLPSGVSVVSRDHTEDAAPGAYNICYINGFQAQEDALDWWDDNHPDVLLRKNGKVVIDQDWNEALLDYSTAAKRSELLGVMSGWIEECQAAGYQALEPDNQDAYSRSGGLLTKSQALAWSQELAKAAHARGLAIAQKNSLEFGTAGRDTAGFDFVVAEECADYELDEGIAECQGYVDVYGDQVYVIEYNSSGFKRACSEFGDRLSVVRRDVNLTAPGSKTYVFGSC
jgi:hypothetical protein